MEHRNDIRKTIYAELQKLGAFKEGKEVLEVPRKAKVVVMQEKASGWPGVSIGTLTDDSSAMGNNVQVYSQRFVVRVDHQAQVASAYKIEDMFGTVDVYKMRRAGGAMEEIPVAPNFDHEMDESLLGFLVRIKDAGYKSTRMD